MKTQILWMILFTTPTYAQIECYYNNKKIIIKEQEIKQQKVHIQEKNKVIHIENVLNFSEVDDYVNVSDSKYNITYSLKCEKTN